jgi:hypothetical protein
MNAAEAARAARVKKMASGSALEPSATHKQPAVCDLSIDDDDDARCPSEEPRCRLVPSLGGHDTIVLAPSEDVVIGRSVRPPDCRSTFYARLDHPKISKQHAHIALSVDGTVLTLTDRSTNGTFIDGAKALSGSPIQLASGSVLSFTAHTLLHAMLPSFSVVLDRQKAAPLSASASAPAVEMASASELALADPSASAHASASAPEPAARKRDVWSVFDDDEDEPLPLRSVAPSAATAAATVGQRLSSVEDDEVEEVAAARDAHEPSVQPSPPRARRVTSPGPHEWHVRRARAFERYVSSETHALLEEAWAAGAPCVAINQEWRVRFEAGAPWPLRQERLDDPSSWRPVKRVRALAAADDPFTAATATSATAASATAAAAPEAAEVPAAAPAPSALPTAAVLTSIAADFDAGAAAAAAHLSPASAVNAQIAEIRRRRAAEHAALAQKDNEREEEEAMEVEEGLVEAPVATKRPPTSAPAPAPSLPPPLPATLPAPRPAPQPAVPLQLCSYNLWFDLTEQEARMREAARVLDVGDAGTARPCVLALQELTEPLQRLLLPRLRQAGFSSWVIQPLADYGVALATRPPLADLEGARFEPFPPAITKMGRGVAMGRVHWPGAGWLVLGSTHLESFVGNESNGWVIANRRKQLIEATGLLEREARRHHCVGAVLLGDLNWSEKDCGQAAQVLGPEWTDAFESLGSPHGHAGTCYSWRFDRALFWTNTDGRGGGGNGRAAEADARALRATAFALHGKKKLGTHPVKNKPLFASDHKALITTLEFQFAGGGGTSGSAAAPARASVSAPKAPSQKRKSPWHSPPEDVDVVCLSD